MSIMEFLEPASQTEERAQGTIPDDSISRSYNLMRLIVGILGLGLPILLLAGDQFILGSDARTRGSLSAYYHSGLRDVFVAILAVTGIMLIAYKISEKNRDNTFSIIAGLAAIGVALFPTGLPEGVTSPTPLQVRLGEDNVQFIHFACAGIFIVSLAIICHDFARRELNRTKDRAGHNAMFEPTSWYRFHMTAAISIVLAIAFIVFTQWSGVFDDYSILIGEVVVTVAFGLSWLAKGLDRDMLPKMTKW